MKEITVSQVLSNKKRISSIDIFRALAILSVVIYHFNEYLPMGYLGVDLFFVISGFLIGRMLIREFITTQSVHFFKFFLSRGFKIWPSYYFFLLFGNLIAYFLYKNIAPDYYIPLEDLLRYLFFIKNFVGTQYHWCFEHLWSLCVEEHFYLVAPFLFIVLGWLLRFNFSKKIVLFTGVICIIVLGIFMRYVLIEHFSKSINHYESTLVRVHELAVGVFMGLLFVYYEDKLMQIKNLYLLFIIGLLVFIALLFFHASTENYFFQTHFFPVSIPFAFLLMMTGIYFVDFSKWKTLRFIAYYSYNWYLWHTLWVKFISIYINSNVLGLLVYMVFTFLLAIVFTKVIEEKCLSYRAKFISTFFKYKS